MARDPADSDVGSFSGHRIGTYKWIKSLPVLSRFLHLCPILCCFLLHFAVAFRILSWPVKMMRTDEIKNMQRSMSKHIEPDFLT